MTKRKEKSRQTEPKGDSACYVDENGNQSNSVLHEEMTAGVDDTELRWETARRLIANGHDEERIKRVLGLV